MKELKIVIAALALSLTACTKAIIDEEAVALPPIQEKVVYSPDVENIMYNYCITCHGGSAPSAGISLTTYNEVKSQAENGQLLHVVNDEINPMPPNMLLPLDVRQKLQKWADDGFPQQ